MSSSKLVRVMKPSTPDGRDVLQSKQCVEHWVFDRGFLFKSDDAVVEEDECCNL